MYAARASTPPTAFCGASRQLGCVGWAARLQRDLGGQLSHEEPLVCGLDPLALALLAAVAAARISVRLAADGAIPISSREP
jgi:hypothetical protein